MVHMHSITVPSRETFKDARRRALESFERVYLLQILEHHTTLAAMSRASGVTRKHLRNLLLKYGLRDRARGQVPERRSAG
jgi:hypothetical protein